MMQKKFLYLAFIVFPVLFSCTEKMLDNPMPEVQAEVPSDSTAQPGLKSARIFYVAKTGSDANSGTSTSPFLTIQKAANIVLPGDVVIIRDGVYTSSGTSVLNINRGGSSTAPVTFRAENKGKAILDGRSVTGYGIIIGNGASYVNIQDLEIKNFLSVGIHCNATLISSYITIRGNKIHDIGRVVSSDAYGRCGIYFRMKNHHWNIDKNLIYNIGRIGPDIWWNKDHAVYIGSVDVASNAAHHNKITSNIIFGCSGSALQITSVYDLIANNIIAWSNENSYGGSPFISVYPATTDLTVANNIFYQPPVKQPYVFGTQYGSTRWIVKNNMVYGGRMWGTNTSTTKAAMKGNNYGRTDCEYPEVNPLFMSALRANAPNVDFHLQTSSRAIDRGVNVGLTSDFYSNPIIGLPNIGAIE